jgi:hypothetical protein
VNDNKNQSPEEKRKRDKQLDKALEESFPGSDPVSISQPAPDEKPVKSKYPTGRPALKATGTCSSPVLVRDHSLAPNPLGIGTPRFLPSTVRTG